jgi:hypothetical protein
MSLVVDACVLRSAGVSGKPTPSECRAVLDQIRNVGKIVSVDASLLQEWRKHQSRYASAWIVSMFSRKLVDKRDGFSGKAMSVENAVSRLVEPGLSVATKDIHLVKIAVDCGYCVISNEKKCRAAFHEASVHCREISKVFWIYPSEPDCCPVVAGLQPFPANWRLDAA